MLAAKKLIYTEQSEVVQTPVKATKKQSKLSKNPWSRYFVMVLITVAVALSITGRYAAIARSGYEIAEIKTKVASLEKEHAALELNVASLKSPGRVQGIATTKLGMQLPDKVYYASATNAAPKKAATNETARTPGSFWGTGVAEAHRR